MDNNSSLLTLGNTGGGITLGSGITKSTSFDIRVNAAFAATIIVTDLSGKTVTATKGSTTITCTWDGAHYIGIVDSTGTWTISDGTNTKTVNVTTATEYNVALINSVGGRIFYDNGSNGATYTFYNSSGNKITTQTVSGLVNAKYYTYTGTPTEDRWYVYDNNLVQKQWGKYGTSISITSDGKGKGKTNTATALTKTGWENNSIFAYIQTMRSSNIGDCDDWFIGSMAEQEILLDTGLVDWYDNSNEIWSSVEYNSNNAYMFSSGLQSWKNANKGTTSRYCFGMRSF